MRRANVLIPSSGQRAIAWQRFGCHGKERCEEVNASAIGHKKVSYSMHESLTVQRSSKYRLMHLPCDLNDAALYLSTMLMHCARHHLGLPFTTEELAPALLPDLPVARLLSFFDQHPL